MRHQLSSGRYYGEIERQRAQESLILTETRYEPHTRIPVHEHVNPYFCLNISAPFSETAMTKEFDVASQAVLFHPARTEHANRFLDAGGHCFNIELSEQWVDEWEINSQLAQESATYESDTISLLAMRLFTEFKRDDAPSQLIQEGLTLELVGEILRVQERSSHKIPQWIEDISQELSERFVDPPSLSELAGEHHVHPVHLARTFRKHQGCSVGEYVRNIRIERACHLLAHTTLSLAEIAFKMGFADQSHFTNLFKRAMGTTPGAYRKSFI